MCHPIYPGELFVIMKSKYDNHWWLIRSSGKVSKLNYEEYVKMFESCLNSAQASVCPDEGTVVVWSDKGTAGIGASNVDPYDPNVWCNLASFAELVKDKLPEPITMEDVYAAARTVTFLVKSEGEVALT